MAQTVIGVFADDYDANRAVDALHEDGFTDAQVDFSSRTSATDASTRRDRHAKTGGFFENLFGSNDEYDETTRNNYREAAARGTVVTVHTKDMTRAERAADILDRFGALDANDTATKLRDKGVGHDDYDTDLAAHREDFTYGNDYAHDDQSVKVIKEDVAIGKQTVQTGGVRVRSRIVEKPVNEEIRLREERVVVNRTPVDRPATEAELNTLKDGTIEVTETAERAVVEKKARVTEEISIGKQASEHVERVNETVRETEVDVEQMAGAATGAVGATRTKDKRSLGEKVHDKLDRDNDGKLVDLNDNDGRIG